CRAASLLELGDAGHHVRPIPASADLVDHVRDRAGLADLDVADSRAIPCRAAGQIGERGLEEVAAVTEREHARHRLGLAPGSVVLGHDERQVEATGRTGERPVRAAIAGRRAGQRKEGAAQARYLVVPGVPGAVLLRHGERAALVGTRSSDYRAGAAGEQDKGPTEFSSDGRPGIGMAVPQTPFFATATYWWVTEDM